MSDREHRCSDEKWAVAKRRDMHHFRPDPGDPGTLPRHPQAAYQAPVEEAWRCTAATLSLSRDKFLQPKVEGVLKCGEPPAALTYGVRQLHGFAQHRVRRQA